MSCTLVVTRLLLVFSGFGPQKLMTLAAYALRRGLLEWLETYKIEKAGAKVVRELQAQAQVGHVPCGVRRTRRIMG